MSKNTVKIAGPNWLQMAAADLQQVQPQTAVADTQQTATRKRATMIRGWREGDLYYREYANLLVARFDKDKRLIQVMEKFLLDNRVMERVFLQPDWATWVNPHGTAYYEDGLHVWLHPSGRVIRSTETGELYQSSVQPAIVAVPKPAVQPMAKPTTRQATLPGASPEDNIISQHLETFGYVTMILGEMLKPNMFDILESCGRVHLVQYEPRQSQEPKLPFVVLPGFLESKKDKDLDAVAEVRTRYRTLHQFLVTHATTGDTWSYNRNLFAAAQEAVTWLLRLYKHVLDKDLINQDEFDFFSIHLRGAVAYPERYAYTAPPVVAARQWSDF